MEKIPEMISTKDLAYICDIFNWNDVMNKKISFYLDGIVDEEIKSEFTKLQKLHSDNCEQLIKLLNEGDPNE